MAETIHARPAELLQQMELAALRDRIAELEEALRHYAKPMTLGSGVHAAFLDVGGVARAALRERQNDA